MKVKLQNFLSSIKGKISKIGHFLKREWITVSASFVSMIIVGAVSMVIFLPNELADVRVDGKPIDQLEYSDRYIATKNIYALLGYDVEANENLKKFVVHNIIYDMITEEYELVLAKELGVEFTRNDVHNYLKESGFTKELFSKEIAYKMAKGDYLSFQNQLAVAEKVVKSEDKLKEFYNSNKNLFQTTKTKSTEQLIFTDKEVAEKVLVEVRKGKDFKSFEEQGAIYITAEVAEGDTKVSTFVSELDKDEISEVVTFGGNHFIIKSLDSDFTGTVLEYEDVKEEVLKRVIEVEGANYYNDLIEKHLSDKEITVK